LLGCFLEFCGQLFAFRRDFLPPATPALWSERFARLLDAFFGGELASSAEHKLLRRALTDLEQHAARAEFAEAFDLTVLRALLSRTLASRLPAHGFLAGGVTFCQLMPMRSIPFKVLCLLGLSDGAFPSTESPFGLDLMQKEPKLGDRLRRDDDRQLFLEALLCARDSLIITYVGQSLKDGKINPPSVLVSELIDHVVENFVLPDAGPAPSPLTALQRMEQRLVVRHPLAAVSPRYFGADADPRLFSYSLAAAQAAVASCRPRQRPAPFSVLHRPVNDARGSITLADLERCIIKPSREFCQQRLALYLGDDLARVEEREPFALGALECWQVATDLLESQRRGEPRELALAVQRAQGRLPLAAAGQREYDRLQGDVDGILRALAETTEGERLPRVAVNLLVNGARITGSIDELWSGAHVRAQYGRLASHHELRHFIRHVVLRCAALELPELRLPEVSTLIGRDSEKRVRHVSFVGLSRPEAVLRELLDVYAAALSAPLALFPSSSRRYAAALAKGQHPDQALRVARDAFTLGTYQDVGSDQRDPYVQQLYADFDAVLDLHPGQFEATAQRVYAPLFEHRKAP
jgi:exodeoxyribonuclease V gamma subunit